MLEMNRLYNIDCMEAMKEIPDGYFDLAIVDPPYGSGNGDDDENGTHRSIRRGGGWFKQYELRARQAGQESTSMHRWDVAPPPEYFDELFRISKNQIIWGGNYFGLPPARCFIIWDKMNISESFSMAMCEYAWTNFKGNAKIARFAPQGTAKERRIHPTQKPVALYKWQLGLYAKPDDRIIDTHAGSASCLVACHMMGFDYMGFEVDPYYFEQGSKRLETEKAQIRLCDLLGRGGV
jgi:site-specific DNA-methyltransferase (adenine-specific)